ncbi:hypothetical protein HGRIS_001146 [Hohenbuehelia grisea]|uniref:Uncharacterized protein n=1 Tax=Hohenbuehelia grisea TaxID=104357 RepID=A0ABR3JPW9_9AGAR
MFSKQPDSRLYIDKMHDMSSRFANWDPGRQTFVPVAGISAGGEIGAEWYHDGVTGVYKSGSQADHLKIFTPLYHLLKLDESDSPIRGLEDHGPSAVAGEECWMPATPPWKSLDSDGEFDEEESDDSDGDNLDDSEN